MTEPHGDGRVPLDPWLTGSGLDDLTANSSSTQIEEVLTRLREALPRDVDALTRETLKRDVRYRLRQCGLTGCDRMIDAALQKFPRSTAATEPADREAEPSVVEDDDPWPTAVYGKGVYLETTCILQKYVVMSDVQARAVALYIATAFAVDAIDLIPILLISSASKRCGKSTLATLLSFLLPRALVTSNVTPAAVYRSIAKYNPSLIADEADCWLTDEKSDLRSIFNAAHSRRLAVVLRIEGDDHQVKGFRVFGPKVLCMIGKPTGTILDRSIPIRLLRKHHGETVARMRLDRIADECSPIRQRWRRWADDHLEAMRRADPILPSAIHDRAQDNWRPLVAVAELLAEGEATRAAALKLSEGIEDDDVNVALLHDCREVFGDKDAVSTKAMVDGLVALDGRPWADWSRGKPITQHKLAARLKEFASTGELGTGIHSRKVRIAGKPENAYVRADFSDAWSRFPLINSEQSEQPNETAPISQKAVSEQTANVPTSKRPIEPMNTGSVPSVPSQIGISEGVAAKEADLPLDDARSRHDDGIF